ncbi:MAG: ImmA/IrrE family metallo-endopeptidase [Bryobacteraceae bacterium]
MLRPIVAFLLFVSALGAQPSNKTLFDQIDPTLEELSKLTGLPTKSKVDRDFITREKLKEFLQTRIDETVKPEEIRVEELTLKLFGFVPENYNLKESTVSLLTEQAAAFYDYRKKKMFLLESAPEISQRFVLIHELAHALADQHFQLEKYIHQGRNDDSATARMAVMEGQAQWLMYELMARKTGQSLLKDPAMVRMFVNASSMGLSQYPELSNAPLYVRESLLFPYTRGLVFQQAVMEKLGDAGFAEVFRRPPHSTRQIMHPELYFETKKPLKIKAPKVPGASRYSQVIEGELGEFDIYILLKQFVDEETADKLSPLWRAGHYRVLEKKENQHPFLSFALQFDTKPGAEEFARLYEEKVIPAKTKRPGSGVVKVEGTRVSILEGIE